MRARGKCSHACVQAGVVSTVATVVLDDCVAPVALRFPFAGAVPVRKLQKFDLVLGLVARTISSGPFLPRCPEVGEEMSPLSCKPRQASPAAVEGELTFSQEHVLVGDHIVSKFLKQLISTEFITKKYLQYCHLNDTVYDNFLHSTCS